MSDNFEANEAVTTEPHPVALIDIGATSVRMAIAELQASGEGRILESLTQAVSLGKDSFIKGRLDRATIEDCVRVLKIYCHKLQEYQSHRREDIRVVATSAVREASNRLAFLDRVYVATGLEVEPFDEAQL
ncbi:MAG: exopolyphosphatase, partial [Planctomycetota bacterium]|nr:exopolyphosphatase [Planctomycetota bacterium]